MLGLLSKIIIDLNIKSLSDKKNYKSGKPETCVMLKIKSEIRKIVRFFSNKISLKSLLYGYL